MEIKPLKYSKHFLILAIIIAVIMFILTMIWPSFENYVGLPDKYLKLIAIPIIMVFIVGYCVFVFLKGGIKNATQKSVKKHGIQKVNDSIQKWGWTFSALPGASQFLYDNQKRGIIIFLINLPYYAAFFILAKIILLKEFILISLIILGALFLSYVGFLIWNIKDARKIVEKFDLNKIT